MDGEMNGMVMNGYMGDRMNDMGMNGNNGYGGCFS